MQGCALVRAKLWLNVVFTVVYGSRQKQFHKNNRTLSFHFGTPDTIIIVLEKAFDQHCFHLSLDLLKGYLRQYISNVLPQPLFINLIVLGCIIRGEGGGEFHLFYYLSYRHPPHKFGYVTEAVIPPADLWI